MAAIDFADQRGEFGFEFTIGLDISARRHGNLQQRYPALQAGLVFQQSFKSADAVRQSFGIIKTIDTQDELFAMQARAQPRYLGARHRVGGAPGEFVDVDADWESGELSPAPLGDDRPVDSRYAKLDAQIVLKVLPILDRLETDKIVGQHLANEFGVVRDRSHRLPLGPWRVQ